MYAKNSVLFTNFFFFKSHFGNNLFKNSILIIIHNRAYCYAHYRAHCYAQGRSQPRIWGRGKITINQKSRYLIRTCTANFKLSFLKRGKPPVPNYPPADWASGYAHMRCFLLQIWMNFPDLYVVKTKEVFLDCLKSFLIFLKCVLMVIIINRTDFEACRPFPQVHILKRPVNVKNS